MAEGFDAAQTHIGWRFPNAFGSVGLGIDTSDSPRRGNEGFLVVQQPGIVDGGPGAIDRNGWAAKFMKILRHLSNRGAGIEYRKPIPQFGAEIHHRVLHPIKISRRQGHRIGNQQQLGGRLATDFQTFQ